MMPCVRGRLPVTMVLWPTQVTVVMYGIGGLPEPGALVHQPAQAAGPVLSVLLDVVGAQLVDDEDHDELRRAPGRGRRRRHAGGHQRGSEDTCGNTSTHHERTSIERKPTPAGRDALADAKTDHTCGDDAGRDGGRSAQPSSAARARRRTSEWPGSGLE